MKKIVYIAIVVIFIISLTSCGSAISAKNESKYQVAGYTLKNKTEIMEQKILHKKSKTIITAP